MMAEVKNAIEFKADIELDINEADTGSISVESFNEGQVVEVYSVVDSDIHSDRFADIHFADGSVAYSVLKDVFEKVAIAEEIA
jgi:hypothetical protein